MAYCAKCGSQLNEGDKACGNCGERVMNQDSSSSEFPLACPNCGSH